MWPHLLCTAIGAWLTAAPEVLGSPEPARTNDHIVGPLIFTFACTAMFQSVRGIRWVNVPFGVWLMLAPWLLDYRNAAMWNDLGAGLLTVGLSMIRGQVRQRFGGGWMVLFRRQSTAT